MLLSRERPGRRRNPALDAAIEEFRQAIHEAQADLIETMYKIAPDSSDISSETDQDLDRLEIAICKLDDAKSILEGLPVNDTEPTEPRWQHITLNSTRIVTECLFGSICLAFLGYGLFTSFAFIEKSWWMFPLLAILCMVLMLAMGRITIWSMNKKLGTSKGQLSDILCSTCFARKLASEDRLIEKGDRQ